MHGQQYWLCSKASLVLCSKSSLVLCSKSSPVLCFKSSSVTCSKSSPVHIFHFDVILDFLLAVIMRVAMSVPTHVIWLAVRCQTHICPSLLVLMVLQVLCTDLQIR